MTNKKYTLKQLRVLNDMSREELRKEMKMNGGLECKSTLTKKQKRLRK